MTVIMISIIMMMRRSLRPKNRILRAHVQKENMRRKEKRELRKNHLMTMTMKMMIMIMMRGLRSKKRIVSKAEKRRKKKGKLQRYLMMMTTVMMRIMKLRLNQV